MAHFFIYKNKGGSKMKHLSITQVGSLVQREIGLSSIGSYRTS
jgi:hypothetical protein